MVCKFCGAELTDKVKFCPVCGKRVDGKRVCPKCGTANDESAAFCVECGTRIDGKKVCSNCGAVYEGNFCPECGSKSGGKATAAGAAEKSTTADKILAAVGLCGVMLAALIGLIFTFLVGVKASADNMGVAEAGMWDCFGDAYEGSDNWDYKFVRTSHAALGTLVVCLGILATAVCTVILITALVRKYAYKKDANVVMPAVWTFMSYAAFATLFMAYCAVNTSAASSTQLTSARMGLNDATLAGLIVGGIAMGVGVCALIAARRNEISAEGVGKSVLVLLSTVAAIVLLAVAVIPGGGIKYSSDNGTAAMNISAAWAGLMMVSAGVGKAQDKLDVGELGMFAYIMLICLVMLCVWLICEGLKQLTGGRVKMKCTPVLAVCQLLFGIAYLIFCVLTANTAIHAIDSPTVKATYTGGIVVLVFSMVTAVSSIVKWLTYKKSENKTF